MDELVHLIRAWSLRVRLQRSLYWLFFGLAGGLGIALIIAILARVFPILNTPVLIALSITCAVIGAVTAFGWPWLSSMRTTYAAWARRFDGQFGLKERLSTALELREGIVSTSNERMRRNQLMDAEHASENIDIKKMLPLRISRRDVLAALAIALALAITVALPNPQQEVLANRAQMQQVLQDQLQQLENAKQGIQQSQALSDDQKKQAIQALDDSEKALSDPNTTPEKALAAINDAQAKLDALHDQNFPAQRDDLQRAGQSLAPDQMTNPLANSLENGNFQKAADQLRNLTQNNGQPLGDQQRQSTADQLDQIASNIQNSDRSTAQQLSNAAQQLRQGQDKAAQDSLNKAADALSQAGQKQAAEQQLNQTQTSMEDARRAVSQTSDQSTAQSSQQQQQQQAQSAQSGTNGQQDKSTQSSAQSAQSNSQQGNTSQDQSGSLSNSSGQSGNAQGTVVNGNGDSAHHEDVGTDNSVYAPSRINTPGQNVAIPDQNGKSVTDPNARTNTGVGNQASVPYQQVYPQYAKTADDAIQNGQVPSSLREYVHDYFSSLDPRQR
jgi:hypothetical protein